MGVPPFMPFLLTNISEFYQFHIIFTKNIESFRKLTKINIENLELKQKTQISSKKLRVREALASFLCPSDVKKSLSYLQ